MKKQKFSKPTLVKPTLAPTTTSVYQTTMATTGPSKKAKCTGKCIGWLNRKENEKQMKIKNG